ncbi:MAG: hypothetical protein QGG36_06265, partial [Pirellulaceae bacterium]|nr:hypothetical protein [Pirellulaceae bacterium]
MAVLFVLGILSITLAVSYAMLHSQTIDIAIHRNVKRTADARHAALTGLSIALRKLHEPDWKGVESRVVGELYANARYEVSFVTGDENLSPEDPRFNEYPFRLTVTSVGVAVDPTDPTVHVSHTVKAVVQLIRRAYSEPASGWDEYKKYGLYQWGPTAGQYQPPFQVAGDVFAAAPLQVCRQHPAGSDSLRSFDGRIDEVALFDRALTELEVVALHQGAAAGELDRVFSVTAPHRRWPFDESSSARFVDPDTGGPTGWLDGATAGAAGVEGTSLRFDGANDLADLGSAPLPATGMSAVCWVNPSENQSRGARLLQHANGPGYAQTEWGLGVTIASDRSVQLWAGVQTAAAAYLTAVSPTPIAADKWTAIAVVYNGNKLQIYQNGKLTASRSSATGGMVRRTGSVLTVGGNPPGSPRADY